MFLISVIYRLIHFSLFFCYKSIGLNFLFLPVLPIIFRMFHSSFGSYSIIPLFPLTKTFTFLYHCLIIVGELEYITHIIILIIVFLLISFLTLIAIFTFIPPFIVYLLKAFIVNSETQGLTVFSNSSLIQFVIHPEESNLLLNYLDL